MPITVFVYSYCKKERSEFDKLNLIYVVFAQTVWLVSNVGVIGLQELSRILPHLSGMITLNPSSLSLRPADSEQICVDFRLSLNVEVHTHCHFISLDIAKWIPWIYVTT